MYENLKFPLLFLVLPKNQGASWFSVVLKLIPLYMFQIITDNCLWKWIIFFLTWKGHCTLRETFFFQIMNTCTPARQCELYSSQLDFLPRFLQYIMVNHYWNGFTMGWNQLWRSNIIFKQNICQTCLFVCFKGRIEKLPGESN